MSSVKSVVAFVFFVPKWDKCLCGEIVFSNWAGHKYVAIPLGLDYAVATQINKD